MCFSIIASSGWKYSVTHNAYIISCKTCFCSTTLTLLYTLSIRQVNDFILYKHSLQTTPSHLSIRKRNQYNTNNEFETNYIISKTLTVCQKTWKEENSNEEPPENNNFLVTVYSPMLSTRLLFLNLYLSFYTSYALSKTCEVQLVSKGSYIQRIERIKNYFRFLCLLLVVGCCCYCWCYIIVL